MHWLRKDRIIKMMEERYIGNFCFCSDIGEFLDLKKADWLEAMEENYSFVTPYELNEAQITAWKDEWTVLHEQLSKLCLSRPEFRKPAIIFEYVLWDFDNPHGVRPDVIILSRDRIGIIEFKTRSIDDENFKYVTAQAKKYRHRLLHNHDESRNMKIGTAALMTSMKDYHQINDRVKCISPDRFRDVSDSLFGLHPLPHPDVWKWIASDYHFPAKKDR